MAELQWNRSRIAWSLGGLMVAVGQLMLDFVDGETVWSVDVGSLAEPRGGKSLVHSLVTGFARAWVTPGALLASLLVLALLALAVLGRISRWVPAMAAGLAWAALVITYAAVAFEVDYVRTPRPGLGILVSALGALVLAVVSRVADEGDLVAGNATPIATPAGSDIA